MDDLQRQIKDLCKEYVPGHDIKHVLRVAALARLIAKNEGYDENEAEAAGLLHDLGMMFKMSKELHTRESVKMAKEILLKCASFSEQQVANILQAISQHSGKTSQGKLANILQDADKLDGLGAMGILRACIANSNLVDYEAEISTKVTSVYPNGKTVMEIIGFMMEWKDMLYTETAKKLAKPRFEYMQKYIEELKREVKESGCQELVSGPRR